MDITEFAAYEGHEVWKISPQEKEEALDWLYENRGKWENGREFKFLVPEEEVPEVVVRYMKIRAFSLRYIKHYNDMRKKMGLAK